DRGHDNSLCRRAANSFRTSCGIKAFETTDPRDYHAKRKRLIQPAPNVVERHDATHLSEIRACTYTKKLHPNEIATVDAYDNEYGIEERKGNNGCQENRDDEIFDWIESHHFQCVNLLGDAHDPKLGG